MEFGIIPHDHWYQPDRIDEAKAKAGREKMVADGVIYGGTQLLANVSLLASLTADRRLYLGSVSCVYISSRRHASSSFDSFLITLLSF